MLKNHFLIDLYEILFDFLNESSSVALLTCCTSFYHNEHIIKHYHINQQVMVNEIICQGNENELKQKIICKISNKFYHRIKKMSIVTNLVIFPGTYPNHLTHLILGNTYNSYIQRNTLPVTLITLIFGDFFNQKFEDEQLLPLHGLKILEFGNKFNQRILNPNSNTSIFPGNLLYLKFGMKFNQFFFPNTCPFPSSLIHLSFGFHFNRPFPLGVLPSNLLHLCFHQNFNQELPPFTLPCSLIHLELGRNYNQFITKHTLPFHLKYLSLGKLIYETIEQDHILPINLQYLELQLSTDNIFNLSILPKSLTCIKKGTEDGFIIFSTS